MTRGAWRERARLVRMGAACALALGAAAAGAQGCAQESTGAHGSEEERVGEAKQAATTPQACVQIVRGGTFGSVADTQIANKLPPKNYGTSQTMNTGQVSGSERRALLRFDVSQIPGGTYANIQNANVSLAQGNIPPSAPGTIDVHRVTAPWSEFGATWQGLGGAYSPAIEASFSNASSFYTFNLHALVTAWVHGTTPNHGILLDQLGPDTTNLWSSEHPNIFFRPALNVCFTVTCAPGLVDCNVNGLDGCEVDTFNDPLNCGGCGAVCPVPANAAAACINGVCGMGACNVGFGDCDQSVANGCETMLTTSTDCGACGVPCALGNASSTCASGTCTLVACGAGFHDCDGNAANGCEAMPCADGSHCNSAAGCQSGVCLNGFCAAPGCADGVENGAETDVDCGGGSCPPCASGLQCNVGSDCAGGVCAAGICQSIGCADSVKNGAETDVDCGGGTCPTCNPGQQCLAGSDCQSGVCMGGVCQAPACNDSVQNGGETAIDCGGESPCPRCPPGQACVNGSDCTDLVCTGNVCQMASCSDGVQNGTESDVDCGGTCAPCNPAQHCQTSADCASGVCVGGFCQPPTCSDGVQNGNETGVDCGGSCFVAETCNGIDDDCNGMTDEGLGSTTCGLGACQVTVPNCVAAEPQTCVPGAPQAEICDGLIDDDCDGVVDNGCACVNGSTQPCYTGSPSTLGVGVCHAGTQTCVFGQWGACIGEVTPTAETCNGLDDDCNAQADEGLGQTVCGAGACQTAQPNCVGGVLQTCTPSAPQPETCDGVDNDCNGQIDDGLGTITCGAGTCQTTVPSCVNGQANICTPGSPAPETCNGLDDDCDGAIDDGLGTISCGTGACQRTVPACANGAPNTCTPGSPSAETCNGIDDDCDGSVDENDPGGGAACTTGQPGVCSPGTTTCVGGALTCVRNVAPSAELCDGLDNDCDGSIDEGNPSGGQACNTGQPGICAAGTTQCQSGTLICNRTNAPTTETCNGLDDDCDGSVDEGNPGGGVSCSTGLPGICSTGTRTCTGGALVCTPDQQPQAETCNVLDDDCNGQIDENNACGTCGGTQDPIGNGGTVAGGVVSGGTAAGGTVGTSANITFNNVTTSGASECARVGRPCSSATNNGSSVGCTSATSFQTGAAVCGNPTGAGVIINSQTASGAQACAEVGRACSQAYNNGQSVGCTNATSFSRGSALCTTASGAGVTVDSQTASGAQACAKVGRACTQAYNNGQTVGCTNATSFSNGSALCGNASGAGVTISSQTSSGAQACAAVGRACTQAYNNGQTVSCTNATTFSSGGGALCGNASGAGVDIDNQTSSGAQACARIGRTCTQAYDDGFTVSCSNANTFNNGSALCGNATGAGVIINNQTSSGAQACAKIGWTCAAAYDDGFSVGCNNANTFNNGGALCAAATGFGAAVNNQTTSGAEECAILGRSCAAAYDDGFSVGCNNANTFNNGSVLCSTCQGAGVAVNNQTSSGAEECAILGRSCTAAYDDGFSVGCNNANTYNNGGALCGAVQGVGIAINNQTTSGSAECGVLGRTCIAAYDDGFSVGCNNANTYNNGGALCGAQTGSGVAITNKTTSGTAECAIVGRSCIQAYDDGFAVGCTNTNTFNNGSANCGSVTGTGVGFSNQTTSGRAKCAAIGRTCTAAYDDGFSVNCTTTNTFGNGAVLCALNPTGQGVTFSSQTTSGNEECAIAGGTCQAVYDNGTSLSCSSANTFQTGVALCSLNDTGVGVSINSQTTSGSEECAILGRTCVAAYDNGSSLSCSSANTFQNGGALCNINQSGVGTSITNKTTSGIAECAAAGSATCTAAYDNGSSLSCSSASTFQNGGALCGSTNGTGITFFNQTTTGTAKCAAIGLVCVKAYDDGSSVNCGTNNAYQNGTALCQ